MGGEIIIGYSLFGVWFSFCGRPSFILFCPTTRPVQRTDEKPKYKLYDQNS